VLFICDEIYLRQGGVCFYCEKPMAPKRYRPKHRRRATHAQGYTVDHFFPRALGFGLKEGKVLAHHLCNERKGMRLPTREELEKFTRLFGFAPDVSMAWLYEESDAA
jgi:hypothetical protein